MQVRLESGCVLLSVQVKGRAVHFIVNPFSASLLLHEAPRVVQVASLSFYPPALWGFLARSARIPSSPTTGAGACVEFSPFGRVVWLLQFCRRSGNVWRPVSGDCRLWRVRRCPWGIVSGVCGSSCLLDLA